MKDMQTPDSTNNDQLKKKKIIETGQTDEITTIRANVQHKRGKNQQKQTKMSK